MTEFFAALSTFLAAHLVPAIPSVRHRLIARMGKRRYLAAYSVLSTVLLAWVIVALLHAPYVPLWTAPSEADRTTIVLMAPAFVLLMAGLVEPNPLSISLSTEKFEPERPGITGVTRHPVLWGFGIWAAAHASVNGALAPLVLFGGMTLLAFGGMVMVDRKRQRQLGRDDWRRLARTMPVIPLVSVLNRSAGRVLTRRTLAGAAAGLGLYFLFLFLVHRAWFGLDPLAGISP